MRARLRWLLAPAVEGDDLVAAAPRLGLVAIFRRFWPYARPYRRWIWVMLVLIVLGPAVELSAIWLVKSLVDDVLVPAQFGPFVWIALGFLAITLAQGVVSFLDDYISTLVAERFLVDLRTTFFRKLHLLSLDFFDRRRLGDVLQRTTGDIDAIETLMLSGVADVMSYVLSIGMFGIALLVLQWDLALAALIIIPALFGAAGMLSRGVKRASREKRRRSGSISAVAEESLSNAMLVQAYNGQDREVERFHRENVGKYEAEMAATRFRGLFTPVLGLIEFVGAVLVLGLGVWELSQGRLTLGGLFAFFAYLARLYGPIQALSNLQGVFFSAAAGAERVIEFLDMEPAIKDRPDAKPLGRARGVVEFQDVSFAYAGSPANALQRVSLRVAPGETLALVGPSGAGKSTIVKLLLRFYEPDNGRVTVDGEDVAGLEVASLRENIAVLLQETLVFDGSVRENISYGRPDATDDDVIAAAKAADAHEFITALPDGYDTVIGEKGRLLSGGQRQRIAIARAMIRDATILVLDEPTTGLDGESGERILEPLRRLMAGRATIIISHNLSTAREATQILVLEEGRIVERGTYAELALSHGTFARLHGADGSRVQGTAVPIGNGRKGKGSRSTRLADALRSARRRAA